MPRVAPYPPDLFAPERRHLFVFAHQDDEAPNAGILQRARRGAGLHVLWVTNGDGLAPEAGEPLDAYAVKRRAESVAAMAALGVGEEALTFLGVSEVAFYAAMADASEGKPGGVEAVWSLLAPAAAQVRAVARAFAPDVVWVQAYQGGHPEHDLSHLCGFHAARALARETGRPPRVFELPAYELTILVPLRFKPWLGGTEHEVWLSDEEQAVKRRVLECYPSQESLLAQFQRLLRFYMRVRAPFARRDGAVAWLSRETFRPVPPDFDHTRSPHWLERLNYPFEEYEGRPVRWDRAIRPMAERLRRAGGEGPAA